MSGSIERHLAEAGIVLPDLPAAIGSYLPYATSGDLVFVSGQLPWAGGKIAHSGRVGVEVSLEDGIAAARLCGLALVAQVRAACAGDLDRVAAVVRLGGFVASEPGFAEHAKVMNGASDLMVQVFGGAGRHARAAVGVASLPLNACVEVEGLFRIRPLS
jgi:enamine deaminase RidA (YjgF/YER057c/UK114 family)